METSLYPRISKLLSERGLCSRREADRYIKQGCVLVDGEVVSTLGTRAHPDSRIELKKEAIDRQSKKRTVILHKPLGIVSNLPEGAYEEAASLITKEHADLSHPKTKKTFQANENHDSLLSKRLSVAGRLDIDSTGLLVLTEDGRIVSQLIKPDGEIEKEYCVKVRGQLTEQVLDKLRFGLELDGKKLKPAQVDIDSYGRLVLVLKEGKKRQIRRMCELVGLEIIALKRTRVGQVELGLLPYGKWRFLDENESF